MTPTTKLPVTESAGSHTASACADIVQRLREYQHALKGNKFPTVFERAADEIMRLRALVAVLEHVVAAAIRYRLSQSALDAIAPDVICELYDITAEELESDLATNALFSAVDAMQPLALATDSGQQVAQIDPGV